MAQTALKSRLILILLACATCHGAHGQDASLLANILDRVPADAQASAASAGVPVQGLRSLDRLSVEGRHRLVLPLPRAEAKAGADRLRERLRQLEILEAVDEAIDVQANRAVSEAEQASARDELRKGERLRQRAVGLQSVLDPTRNRFGQASLKLDEPAIRLVRAGEPFSLLAWNSGSYMLASTPHFSIASQAGDRPTAEMAQACELAYEVWSQLFSQYFHSEQTDAPKLEEPVQRPPFRVVMFRTRDAYVKALRAIEPKIGVSTGYYSPRHRISFFYWDGAKSLPTLVHELTHQFFQEWGGREPAFDPSKDPGFWAIEGVALYLESLSMQKIGGAVIVDIGGWDAPRLQAGRYRRLHDEYWIPWETFSQLDGNEFRNSQEIAAWYSQACGLVHRWLDGSDEDFESFVEYLQAVYAGEGAEAALQLATDDEAMRSSYDQYLMTSWRDNGDDDPRPFFPNRKEAVLSRCDATSRDLLDWPIDYRSMDWLDLSFSKVDDDWLLQAEEHPWQVVRLNLESTDITDLSLSQIGRMKELRELDLTRCNVTDAGIALLKDHPNLRQLWLGQTQVTDASVPLLLSLPRLERLSIEGSGISQAGWKQILAKKPYLKR